MNLTSVSLAIGAGLRSVRRDPLMRFRFASAAQAALAKFAAIAEVLHRAGNSAGKTKGAAAVFVAIMRGLSHLDGVRLPVVPQPAVGWILTKSYRQQVDSVQAAVVEMVGEHPHEIVWAHRGKGYIDTIWVATARCKHPTGQHCKTCSRIAFHCEQSGDDSALGGRVDVAWADEPPKWRIWREIRARKKAGLRLILFITATPEFRQDWEEMAKDFSFGSNRVVEGRVEVRSTMYDNRFLTDEDRAEFLRLWKGDPLLDARVNGEYVDTSGMCPWGLPLIQAHEKHCRTPKLTPVKVLSEVDTSVGRELTHKLIHLETFDRPEPDETYWVLLDPAAGIEDKLGHHDPSGLQIWARRRPRMVARYNGYLSPNGLGRLGVKCAKWYNRAWIDAEVNGLGQGTVDTIAGMRYPYMNREQVERDPGQFTMRAGWMTTETLRGRFMGAIGRWLEEMDARCPSQSVLSCLRGITIAPGGKYLALAGRHDEDMILLGRALTLLADQPDFAPRKTQRRTFAKAVNSSLGRTVLAEDDEDELPTTPDRWRRRR